MFLDLPTLSIILTCTAVLSAIILFIIWRINRSMEGVFHWMVASLLIGLAFLAIFSFTLLGLPAGLDTFVSNALSLPAVLLVLEGCLRFRGFPSARRWRLMLLSMPLLVVAAWLLRNDAQLRYLFHDAVSALGLGAAGVVMIWRNRSAAERRVLLLSAGSSFLLAAAFAMRWTAAATAPDAAAVAIDMPASLLLYLALVLFSIGWTYGVALACYFRSQQRVMQLAREDALTGLPNRRSIDEELERNVLESRRSGRGFVLVMLDVNDFKSANDRYGHLVGDRLLQVIAERLNGFLRGSDFAGRLGGDEFLVLARDVSASAAAETVRLRLARAVEGPVILHGGERFDVRVSAGAALWSIDGETAEALLRAADRQMYRDKTADVCRTH